MRRKQGDLSRRDFLNGVALSLAAGTTLAPFEILAQAAERNGAPYPPALTGMRGSHPGSFEIAHALARHGQRFATPPEQTGPVYDLVVVGGGISGLSAARFFRDRRNADSHILVLDNHDDFGGHAKRNEFSVDGKTLLGYGGSQTIDSPAKYSRVAKQLLRDLNIHTERFYEYFDQNYFKRRGLTAGIYFDRASFGVDRLVANPLGGIYPELESEEAIREAVNAMPLSKADKAGFLRLLAGGVDYLEDHPVAEKQEILNTISYLDFLERYVGVPESIREILRDTFLPLIAVGWEAASALEAAHWWFPGTRELGVQVADVKEEPYIHHFPDGNASIARALVRDLVPGAIPGKTMEDLVTARADYTQLDKPDSAVKIRLNSTVVNVAHTSNGEFVDVSYVRDGEVFRARARHAVLACYNGMIPYLCSELPEEQIEAIQYATKVPFVIGNIVIRNWRAFAEAGHHTIYSPGDVYFKYMPLDFPVSMGNYRYSGGPDEPIVISAWYSPTMRGLPAKQQYRLGRQKLLEMSYDDFEQNIFSHLDGMLGDYGFDAEREIAAITLNRWPHGYAYEFEGLGVPREYSRHHGPHIRGRERIGRISIANSDSEAYAYVDGAIDAADRAVDEQLS
ncbi:MAG: NAD(P)-binding protein [Woeseia sp.]